MIYFGIPGLVVFLIIFFGVINLVVYKTLWNKVNSKPERSMVIFDANQYRETDKSETHPM